MMEKGLRMLYTGDFNAMNQERQPDGSIVVTLSKRGEGKIYRFHVQNLYKENEEILEHEVIDKKPPGYILDRMKKAKEHEHKSDTQPGGAQETTLP